MTLDTLACVHNLTIRHRPCEVIEHPRSIPSLLNNHPLERYDTVLLAYPKTRKTEEEGAGSFVPRIFGSRDEANKAEMAQ